MLSQLKLTFKKIFYNTINNKPGKIKKDINDLSTLHSILQSYSIIFLWFILSIDIDVIEIIGHGDLMHATGIS